MHICNHNHIVRIHYFFFPVLSRSVARSVRLKAHTGPPPPLCLIFLCRHNARHNLHHLQTLSAPWPAQRQWHRRHRTHCSACAGRTLSGKPGISFIEHHYHLAKCSCPTCQATNSSRLFDGRALKSGLPANPNEPEVCFRRHLGSLLSCRKIMRTGTMQKPHMMPVAVCLVEKRHAQATIQHLKTT